MKHVVTDLNEANETLLFCNSILGNYYFDTYNKVILFQVSCMVESYEQSKTLNCTQITEPYCNIVYFNYTNIDVDINKCLSYSSNENVDQIQD